MRDAKRRPSAGTVLGTLALIFAISGVAVALPGKNTVDSGDIKNKQVKKADIAKPKVRAASLINGWHNDSNEQGNPARIVKDVLGVVRLEGIIDDGSNGSTAFVLPQGFRPPNEVFLGLDSCGTEHARAFIAPNGEVEIAGDTVSTCTSLEGATFRAR